MIFTPPTKIKSRNPGSLKSLNGESFNIVKGNCNKLPSGTDIKIIPMSNVETAINEISINSIVFNRLIIRGE